MRKRTYTALEDSGCVSKWVTSSQDVLQTDKKKSTQPVLPITDVLSTPNVSAIETPALALGVAQPDSLCDLKSGVATSPFEVSSNQHDDTPLTTIHNLVRIP